MRVFHEIYVNGIKRKIFRSEQDKFCQKIAPLHRSSLLSLLADITPSRVARVVLRRSEE